MDLPLSFGKKQSPKGPKKPEKTSKDRTSEPYGLNMFITPSKTQTIRSISEPKEHIETRVILEPVKETNTKESDLNYEAIFPVTKEFSFSPHKKAITSIGVDPTGTRMVTGSQDGAALKFWDFPSMDKSLKNFRELEVPHGFVMINHIKFNKLGDLFVSCPNNNQPKLYTRDAALKGDFQIGDTYLSDLSKTFGHTGPVKGVDWHPLKRDTILTCSQDSTMRMWKIDTLKTKSTYCIKAKSDKGYKLSLSSCSFHPFGKFFGAGCSDGSIQIFDEAGPYHKPQISIKNGHILDVTCINFGQDDHTFISRSMDNSMKVFDIRNASKPIKSFDGLLNLWEQTDCIFSQHEDWIITGTSAEKNQGTGQVVFMDAKTLDIVYKKNVSGSVIRVVWHPKLNQIILGSSDYNLHFLYDEEKSQHGIMDAIGKEVRHKYVDEELQFVGNVHVPNALPMFQPTTSESLLKYRERKDATKTQLPQQPDSQIGPGYRGKIGTSQTQYLLKQSGYVPDQVDIMMDPREAILKFAKEAEENPQFVDIAYKKTQPVRYYDASHIGEEEREAKKKKM